MTSHEDKVSFIWSVAELLRGPYKPARNTGESFCRVTKDVFDLLNNDAQYGANGNCMWDENKWTELNLPAQMLPG